MRAEKESIRHFYETFGWRKNRDGVFYDNVPTADNRAVLETYYSNAHLRLRSYIHATGKYFLDAGCGPMTHPAFVEDAAGYTWHVGVDLSHRAVREARSKLGARGLCVVADLAHLPFPDGLFDVAVCHHVLYHVPPDEQGGVTEEICRTLRCGARCVMIYCWPNCILTRLAVATSALRAFWRRPIFYTKHGLAQIPGLRRLKRLFIRPLPPPPGPLPEPDPPLYFGSMRYRALRRVLPKSVAHDIRVWRSADVLFTKALVPDNAWGRFLMDVLWRLECRFPRIMARLGRYPLIILDKQDRA